MIGQGLHRFSGQFLIVVFLFVEVVLVGELVANLEGGSCEGWPPIVAASYFLKCRPPQSIQGGRSLAGSLAQRLFCHAKAAAWGYLWEQSHFCPWVCFWLTLLG